MARRKPSRGGVCLFRGSQGCAFRPSTSRPSRACCKLDGYNGFKQLAGDRADASVRLAFCWSHMRRGFYDFHVSTKSPLAAEVLARIRIVVCVIKAADQGSSRPSIDDACDKNESRPIVEALHAWLEYHLPRVSGVHPDLALAMRYALRHWSGLVVFLDDGRESR